MITVGVIVGSTRPGRIGSPIARWIAELAGSLPGIEVDLIELAEVALPFLDEPEHASTGIYTQQHTRDWSARIGALDAFILVTPEYNFSFSAPLKNALDYLSEEWNGKAVALVGYGGTSSGTRAVQALLPVITSLGMLCVGTLYIPFRQRLDAASGTLVLTEHDAQGALELARNLQRVARSLSAVTVA